MSLDKKRDKIFLISLVIIHGIFFLYQLLNNNIYLVDSQEYLLMVKNIAGEFSFYCGNLMDKIDPQLFTKRPPVYPIFILIIKVIFQSDFIVLLFQNVLSIVSIILARKIIILLGYKRESDLTFLLLILFSPAQMIYTNFIMSESLFQLFLIAACYSYVLFIKENNWKNFFWYNLFIVLAIFTKPVLYLFIAPNCFLMIYLFWKFKRKYILSFALIPIIFVLTYSYANYQRTTYFHFSSIQTINLVNYNVRYFLVKSKGEQEANNFLEEVHQQANQLPNYSQKATYLNKSALDVIQNNFFSYSLFHLNGAIGFFLDPGRFDLTNFFSIEKSDSKGFLYLLNKHGIIKAFLIFSERNSLVFIFALVIIAIVNVLKLIGLLFFSFDKRVDPSIKLFLLILIGYLVFATGPLGASRFSMPIIPIIGAIFLLNIKSIKLYTIKHLSKVKIFSKGT